MGITESSYWLSWFLYYLIGLTFVTLVQALLLTYGVFNYSDFGPIFMILCPHSSKSMELMMVR